MQALSVPLQYLTQFKRWIMREEHKQKAREVSDQIERAFTEHPKQTGETYLVHLWFTIKMTSRLVYSSVVLMIHGLFPFLFTKTASSQMEKIWMIMRSRIPENRREELRNTWHV